MASSCPTENIPTVTLMARATRLGLNHCWISSTSAGSRLTTARTKSSLAPSRTAKLGAHPWSSAAAPARKVDRVVILLGLYRDSQMLAGRAIDAEPTKKMDPSNPACMGLRERSSVMAGSITPMETLTMGMRKFMPPRNPITTQP